MKPATLVCLFALLAAVSLLAQNNPVPMINNPLVPSSAAPGSAGFTLTVNGSGFVSNSKVNWNGTLRPTTFFSATRLTAVISTTDLAAPTTARVTVSNPSPGGGTSNVAGFAVTTPTSGSAYVSSRFDRDGVLNPSISLDVNRDGHVDVIRVSAGVLYIHLGKGDGTFQSTATYTIESGTAGVAAGDFNRDGKPDLAVANTNGTVSILVGNGDGSFQAHIDYPTGPSSNGVAVGDLDGDGNADIVVANNSPAGGVSVLLGLGNGLFQNQVAYAAGPTPSAVTLADFNGDGKLDVAVADFGAVSVLFGNGDGTLQRAKVYNLRPLGDAFNYSILAADFNADAIPDLAIGGNGIIYFLRGTSSGVFTNPNPVATSFIVKSMVAGDFNEDGKLDFVTASGGNTFYLVFGNGDGTFQSVQAVTNKAAGLWISAGDFNEDGYVDVGLGDGVSLQTTASISATALLFPNTFVGQASAPRSIVLNNYAAQSLDVGSISITSGSADFDQTNDCGTSVAANSSCTVSVVFSPSAAGDRTGTLMIAYDAIGSPQNVSLSGTAIQPKLPVVTLNPISLTFGNQKVGTTSAPQNITLTNTGLATLTITSIVASGDFAQVNTCGATLRVGQNCTLIVTFTPTATGTRNGDIAITDNALDSPQSIPLTGTGTP